MPPFKEIADCKTKIKEKKPRKAKVGDVDGILAPSDQKHWQTIRFFPRMNKSIKDKFRGNDKVKIPEQSLALSKEGECGSGSTVGQAWDNKLSKIIEKRKEGEIFFAQEIEGNQGDTEEPEFQLLQALFNKFKIEFLDYQFPLYGYMYSKMETQPKVYYWEGDADAIGWCKDPTSGEGRYVIVDWKVLGDIATFWQKSPDAYGRYLHQCLVYARLLQLHMDLNYLPHILIVPIHNVNGKDFHPALFSGYPKECTDCIEDFEWSVTFPEQSRAVKISPEKPFNKEKLKKGKEVDKKMLLADFFSKGATVGDLMKIFEWPSLQVV